MTQSWTYRLSGIGNAIAGQYERSTGASGLAIDKMRMPDWE